MPPKRRVAGKGKKGPPVVELDDCAKEQLRAELDWTVVQLQLNIQNSRKREEVDKLNKVVISLSKQV